MSSKIRDKSDGGEESGVLQLERKALVGDLIWVKLHGNSWWPALVVDENGVSASCKPGNRSEAEVLVRLYGSYEYLYADLMKYYSEFKMVLGQNNGNLYEIFDKALEQDCSRIKSIKPKGKGSKSTGNKKLNQNQVDESNPDATAGKSRESKADIQKKLKRKTPSTDKQAKNKANEQERVQKKQRKNNQIVEKMKPTARTAKQAIKQSAVLKKMPESSNSDGQKRSKTSKQSEEQNKGKPNSPSSGGTNSRTPKPDKKSNGQSSETTTLRKSPKCSARRMRVMQGLGLAAPPGSPFQKN